MELTLIIKDKKFIQDDFKLEFGLIEDLLDIIDIEKIDSDIEIAKMVLKAMKQLKPFVKSVFPEITDEEIRKADPKDLIKLFTNIFVFTFSEFSLLSKGN